MAYWAPLLHLLHFGLGWTRPDRGLAAWIALGCPTDDPVLAVVSRWWPRERLEDFLAYAGQSRALIDLGGEIASRGGYRDFESDPLPDEYAHLDLTRSGGHGFSGRGLLFELCG
ncbi:hypothetical protein ASF47_04235 [Nocardioides sp. Leaf285]|nr:hypothetical protein ASF47_04235 [Nocardioides sp. Leaf285]